VERIESIDDPRVAAYRDLKARTARGEAIFVTEGRTLTIRLLQSPYAVESVLVAERFADLFAPLVEGRSPLYVADERLLSELVGFRFHLGVLGCGRRGRPMTLEEMMTACGGLMDKLTLIVCPRIADRENLGAIFRLAGAFGVGGVILGAGCCDPFSRRCLRVSMGAVLGVRLFQSPDLRADLALLKDRWGVELWATVVDDQAVPLSRLRRPARLALLLGNEWQGLESQWVLLCHQRVTIPMGSGADSLNVAVAAGIFLYELTKATS